MVFAGMIKKDFDIRRLSLIIQVGSKSNQKYPYKWEAERDRIEYMQKKRRQREDGDRNWSDVAISKGTTELEEARNI